MRAKVQVTEVKEFTEEGKRETSAEKLSFSPVAADSFDANGVSEDNDFARWTPTGLVELYVTNPTLFGKFKVNAKFYIDFTPA